MDRFYSNILEINPKEIFKEMKKNIYNFYPKITKLNINQEYIKIRVEIINLIRKIYKKMRFKSQTFFLSIYYLDIILIENKITNLDFHLLGLVCFIVASKYCENDPNVPPLNNFLNIYNKYNFNSDKIIRIEELFYMEVKVLKYLNYKLQYATIYDFNLFFFNHGIIKKQQIKDIINNNVNLSNNKNNKSDISSNEEDDNFIFDGNYIKKILEKIYKKSRYYIDIIMINDKIIFKYSALLLSIFIMKKSIAEVILNEYKLKNKDYYINKKQILKKTNLYFKEIMVNFYNVDYESNEIFQELINDIHKLNIFPHQEKKNYELNNNKNSLNTNLIPFRKIFPNSRKCFTKKNNNNNINGISNLATSSTTEENQSPKMILNCLSLKNKKNLGEYNSKENIINRNYKLDNTLFGNYNKSNKIFYAKTLENKKGSFYNNNNSNADNGKNVNSFNSNSKTKEKSNCTFTQLKNNLKKNFSMNKKRCKDKCSHINNLKALCKLSSCSNTIKNIKEASFIQNNIIHQEKLQSPEKNSDKNISLENDKNNISNNLLIKKIKRIKNIKNSFLKNEKIDKSNNSINLINNKKDSLNESNNSNNDKKNNYSLNINKKEKNIIRIRFRTNDTNAKYNNRNEINKPYFKKLIPNFEPIKKNSINKNNTKNNIINKSNSNNFKNNIDKTNSNAYFDKISLSYNVNKNKKELIKKRIININQNIIRKNENLENLLINKNNFSQEKLIEKFINNETNPNENLIDENTKERKKEYKNMTRNKILKIPKKRKNLKISTNYYQNKISNTINDNSNKMNLSPILFVKDVNH